MYGEGRPSRVVLPDGKKTGGARTSRQLKEIAAQVSGSPPAAVAAAGCGRSVSLGRLLLTQLRAAEPTITYNRCCLRAVTVDVKAAQYVIFTMSSGQHSLHARRLVASFHLLTATTWNLARAKREAGDIQRVTGDGA